MRAAAALLLAALAVPSTAGASERAELTMPFNAATTGTETGLTLDVRYLSPEGRDYKPPAITKVVLRLPEGTRLDTGALPACEATNDEIRAQGRDACPPDSKVGEGQLEAYVGAPGDPQHLDLTLFNGRAELIEVVTFQGTNATAGIDRLHIEGNVLTGNPPNTPGGPPDGRTAVSRITWDIPAHGGYLVTPPTCGGHWRATGEFGFSDGGETTVVATQPCEAPDASPPTFTVAATPRALTRGRETPMRVQLASDDPACLEGAVVRLGRRATTTDAQGRATLPALVRWRRPAAQLRVLTAGCGRSAVPIIIRACRRPPSQPASRSTRTRSKSTTRGRRASPSRCR